MRSLPILFFYYCCHCCSRAPIAASPSFRLKVSILAIAIEKSFHKRFVALASPDLFDRSTTNKIRSSPRNPRRFDSISPHNPYIFSGCNSFLFSGGSRYLPSSNSACPLLDPHAPYSVPSCFSELTCVFEALLFLEARNPNR